jgi:hypothetical protein
LRHTDMLGGWRKIYDRRGLFSICQIK